MKRTDQTMKLAAVALVASLISGCGCDRREPVEEPVAETKPVSRMHDPVYLEQLKKQTDERTAIMKEITAARKRLEQAKEAGDQAQVEAVTAEIGGMMKRFEENRLESQRIVGARIRQETGVNKNFQKGK